MGFDENQPRDEFGRWTDAGGNQVIGKTETGKNVYNLPASNKLYTGFNPQEHASARRAHEKLADKLKNKGINFHQKNIEFSEHIKIAAQHLEVTHRKMQENQLFTSKNIGGAIRKAASGINLD